MHAHIGGKDPLQPSREIEILAPALRPQEHSKYAFDEMMPIGVMQTHALPVPLSIQHAFVSGTLMKRSACIHRWEGCAAAGARQALADRLHRAVLL